MRIGVIADTHGDLVSVYRAMQLIPDAAAWLHLGDEVNDADVLIEKSGAPVYTVRGNCDTYSTEFPMERTVRFDGVSIFMTHGHRYAVAYDRSRLCYRAEELGCSLAVYGHTHISLTENNGRVIAMNPGSTSHPRGGRKASIAYVDISGTDFTTGIILI